ncbi:hypothetical protein [Streptomyces sp. NPDC002547]
MSSIERLSTLLSQSAVRPTGAVDTNRTDTNTWITDQVDFTTPKVSYADTETALAVPVDPNSTTEPLPLKLDAGTAPKTTTPATTSTSPPTATSQPQPLST